MTNSLIEKQLLPAHLLSETEYQILTVGSTDYTLIGASANTVGINFTASGVGSGSGTAYSWTVDIIL